VSRPEPSLSRPEQRRCRTCEHSRGITNRLNFSAISSSALFTLTTNSHESLNMLQLHIESLKLTYLPAVPPRDLRLCNLESHFRQVILLRILSFLSKYMRPRCSRTTMAQRQPQISLQSRGNTIQKYTQCRLEEIC
jgi:hypothetical protein